jgi:hypothetical protein
VPAAVPGRRPAPCAGGPQVGPRCHGPKIYASTCSSSCAEAATQDVEHEPVEQLALLHPSQRGPRDTAACGCAGRVRTRSRSWRTCRRRTQRQPRHSMQLCTTCWAPPTSASRGLRSACWQLGMHKAWVRTRSRWHSTGYKQYKLSTADSAAIPYAGCHVCAH